MALMLLGMFLFMVGCNSNGSSGQFTASPESNPALERQAINNLLELYRTAMLQEDIDRMQDLLATDPPAAAAQDDTLQDAGAFRDALTATFQAQRIGALQILDADIAPDRRKVTVTEIITSLELQTRSQRTRMFRTTLHLRADVAPDITTLRITAVRRDGPLLEIITPGQILAATLAPVEVQTFQLDVTEVQVLVPDTLSSHSLSAEQALWRGTFTPPAGPQPQPLRITVQVRNGPSIVLEHPYSLRIAGEGVVERLAGTGDTQFFAVTVAADGTVWAGGTDGGSLYQIAPDTAAVLQNRRLFAELDGRVEDLTFDTLGRLHAIAFSFQQGTASQDRRIQDSGDYVLLPSTDIAGACQTVNTRSPAYPFQAPDGPGGSLAPSTSTRTVAAQDGAVWLFGSEGGAGLATDDFRQEPCLENAVMVRYEPFLSRTNSGLPSNAVQAFVAARDGALWFGTALGLVRRQGEQFTPVLFDRTVTLRGDVTTLEAFFSAIAQAIFEARPLTSVALGEVSFSATFGAALVKEDLMFSAAEDQQGRLWAGTLGGGLRRIDVIQNAPVPGRHLTRVDGLLSNIIFALAVAPDGAIWAATDEGVSRLQDTGDAVTITNFSVLDGLAVPVRDLAIDAAGNVWLATDGGLYRLRQEAGQVSGMVRDEADQPVQGAEVTVVGTTLRTFTDAAGHFTLTNVPRGRQFVGITGEVITASRLTEVFQEVNVPGTTPLSIVLRPVVSFDPVDGGQVIFPYEPQAFLSIPPGATQLPAGVEAALQLTVLPLSALPQPLPAGFQATAAARLAPVNIAFSAPIQLTVPNQAALPAGQFMTLFVLDEATLTYAAVGAGQVSADGSVITTVRSNLMRLAIVVFAVPSTNTPLRLLRVSGNNQNLAPGQSLPTPLVVRIEDQFGNPVSGIAVQASIIRNPSNGTIGQPVQMSNAQGEVRFALQAGTGDADLVVEMAIPSAPQVPPVQFFTIIGMVDIDDLPLDIAVSGDTVYIAAGFSGLQVINAQNPAQPQVVQTIPLAGVTFSVAVTEDRLYAATFTPTALYVFDRREPKRPVLLNTEGLRLNPQFTPVQLRVQDTTLYLALEDRSARTGALLVVDVTEPATPTILGNLVNLGQPTGLTVVDGFAYLATTTLGLIVIDVRDPSQPLLSIEGSLFTLIAPAGITHAGQRLFMIESSNGPLRLLALDISTPGFPRQREAALLRSIAVPFTAATISVAGDFAYVASFDLGLQVFDIHSLEAPRLVGSIDTPSVAFNTATSQGAEGTRIYITDLAVGLNIAAGPPVEARDTDGDGVIDFFDAFPSDPTEALDTDRDGIGNNADPDDDNDRFSDAEELQRNTDPLNARDFPITAPVLDATNTLFVDASVPDQFGDGSAAHPYRSISAALKAFVILRNSGCTEHITVSVQSGVYSALHTMETFPLFLNIGLLTLRGVGETPPIIDAAFFADVLQMVTTGVTLENLVLQQGVNGIAINASILQVVNLQRLHIRDNLFIGLTVGGGVPLELTDSEISNNGFRGVEIFNGSHATIAGSTIRGNGDDGVLVFRAKADLGENHLLSNSGNGVHITRESDATLRNNTIQGNGGRGVQISDLSTTDRIEGNDIRDNAMGGIRVQTTSIASLMENSIVANGSNDLHHGILVASGSMATMSRNEVRDNTGAGILLFGSDSIGTIRANRVFANLVGINVFQKATAEIQENVIRDSRRDGVWLNEFAKGTLISNTIENNERNGVLIQNGASARINGDTIAMNADHGIALNAEYDNAPLENSEPPEARIGLIEGIVMLSQNAGFGLFVNSDGSRAFLVRARVIFDNNALGPISGDVEILE